MSQIFPQLEPISNALSSGQHPSKHSICVVSITIVANGSLLIIHPNISPMRLYMDIAGLQ